MNTYSTPSRSSAHIEVRTVASGGAANGATPAAVDVPVVAAPVVAVAAAVARAMAASVRRPSCSRSCLAWSRVGFARAENDWVGGGGYTCGKSGDLTQGSGSW